MSKKQPTPEAIQSFAAQHGYDYAKFIETFEFENEDQLDRNCIYLDKVVGQIDHEDRLNSNLINEEEYYA